MGRPWADRGLSAGSHLDIREVSMGDPWGVRRVLVGYPLLARWLSVASPGDAHEMPIPKLSNALGDLFGMPRYLDFELRLKQSMDWLIRLGRPRPELSRRLQLDLAFVVQTSPEPVLMRTIGLG